MKSNYPLQVAVVIPKYGLLGGAEGFVYNLTERLALRDGFYVHVFANKWRQGKAPIVFHKIPIIPFPRWIQPISFAFFSRKAIYAGKYDIVHSHDRIFEMDLFTFHGIPHKTWIKETKRDRLSFFDQAMVWVEQKAFNNPKGPIILPVSTLVKEEILKVYDVPESKIRVIHPGVSMDRFSTHSRETCRQEIRQRFNLSLDDVVVLFVSMNFELKRLDLVIKGIADLVEKEGQASNMKLLVVGKGDSKRFMALAHDLGISKRVVFAGVTNEVEKYYLACDIFAMPSKLDTFGLAVLEAMAASLPVIITSRVGARDIVKSGINGFILSENPSVSEMTASFAALTKSEKRLQMGENSRQIAIRHTWDTTAERVAELYQQLINDRNHYPESLMKNL
ncbi:glycosyltransferase family 4 protein [Thermodesulfobacteriota bacterium]